MNRTTVRVEALNTVKETFEHMKDYSDEDNEEGESELNF